MSGPGDRCKAAACRRRTSSTPPVRNWPIGLQLEDFSCTVTKAAKAKINGRIAAMQGLPQFPEPWISAYNGWPKLLELRIVRDGVQYRPFGFYGPGLRQFSLLTGAVEKGKVPKRLLEVADERRKIVIADPSRVRPHDFS